MYNQNLKKIIDTSSPVLLTWRHVHDHSCKPKTEQSSTCAKVLSHCGASNCIPSAAVICAKIRGKMYCTALYCITIYCTARSYILNTVLRISWAENMFGTHSEFLRSWNILDTLNRVTLLCLCTDIYCTAIALLHALLFVALLWIQLIAQLSRWLKHPWQILMCLENATFKW